jgi:S1-C subfamily serine protease
MTNKADKFVVHVRQDLRRRADWYRQQDMRARSTPTEEFRRRSGKTAGRVETGGAIGSPLGYEGDLTAGIVSSNFRDLKDVNRLSVRRPRYLIQTDAAIARAIRADRAQRQ